LKEKSTMSDPFIGEIKMVSFNFPPKGWAFCNGQLLPINQNQALFSLLGTMYGGNGQTTFALPDLRGCSPVHVGSGLTQGGKGGETAHALVLTEMPVHTHIAQASSGAPNQGTPANNVWAALPGSYSATADSKMNPASDAPVGGGQPHENMQPYLVINFVIALVGIYPSRN
jgi:microcystin-dependent protein